MKKRIIIEDNFYDFKTGYFQYCILWNIQWEIMKLLINQPVDKYRMYTQDCTTKFYHKLHKTRPTEFN